MKARILSIFLVTLSAMLCLGACKKETPSTSVEWVEYDEANLSEYVFLDAYEGFTISLTSAEETKGEAVWRFLVERATIQTIEDIIRNLQQYTRQTMLQVQDIKTRNFTNTLAILTVILHNLLITDYTIRLHLREVAL